MFQVKVIHLRWQPEEPNKVMQGVHDQGPAKSCLILIPQAPGPTELSCNLALDEGIRGNYSMLVVLAAQLCS